MPLVPSSPLLAIALAVALAGTSATAGNASPPKAHTPSKVVVIVVDGLSTEIVDKYKMRNVQALMRSGADAPNAYLGHLGAVTVVTHNVITTGALPKNMGWTDEGYRDVDGVLPNDTDDPGPHVADQQLRLRGDVPAAGARRLSEARRVPPREATRVQGRGDQPEDVRRVGTGRRARGPDRHLLRPRLRL